MELFSPSACPTCRGQRRGWVHDLWQWSPAAWIYRLYYLQDLCIVIPGTIAGDLMLQWSRTSSQAIQKGARSALVYCLAFFLMIVLLFVLLCGLKARWLLSTTLLTFGLCGIGLWLFSSPRNEIEALYKNLFHWAVYWLVLGLIFEPYEGGIKKDHPTMSYYFITSGLAICVFIALSIIINVFQQERWLRLLTDNGQNPMIAYAGINNFTIPAFALTGLAGVLDNFAATPWRGFWKGAVITLFTALTVSLLTRRNTFWRT